VNRVAGDGRRALDAMSVVHAHENLPLGCRVREKCSGHTLRSRAVIPGAPDPSQGRVLDIAGRIGDSGACIPLRNGPWGFVCGRLLVELQGSRFDGP
jgi:hypothetical protein